MTLTKTEQKILNQLKAAKSGRLDISLNNGTRMLEAMFKLKEKHLVKLVETSVDWQWEKCDGGLAKHKVKRYHYIIELGAFTS